MKALYLLPLLLLSASALVQAAPSISHKEISEEALKGVATERQRASIENYHRARREVEQQRAEEAKKAREVTEKNDAGMKKTIIKRSLNNMMPPCEREMETPREPDNYIVR